MSNLFFVDKNRLLIMQYTLKNTNLEMQDSARKNNDSYYLEKPNHQMTESWKMKI